MFRGGLLKNAWKRTHSNELSAQQKEENYQTAYTFISFFSFVMHTFGAMTPKCKLIQHTRASQKRQ